MKLSKKWGGKRVVHRQPNHRGKTTPGPRSKSQNPSAKNNGKARRRVRTREKSASDHPDLGPGEGRSAVPGGGVGGGGYKNSGIGRESGVETIKEFLTTKCVWISTDLDVPDPFVRR